MILLQSYKPNANTTVTAHGEVLKGGQLISKVREVVFLGWEIDCKTKKMKINIAINFHPREQLEDLSFWKHIIFRHKRKRISIRVLTAFYWIHEDDIFFNTRYNQRYETELQL